MNTNDPDDGNDAEKYELTAHDEMLLAAAKALLQKVIQSGKARPAQLLSIAKLLHALNRLPRVTDDLQVYVSVSSPCRKFGEIETWHWWDVTLEHGNLRLSSGGHFFRPSTGGDTFTTMTLEANPGEAGDFSDYLENNRIVPDICSYEEGVARVDFAVDGFTIEVTDEDNPLLEEAGDEIEGEEATDEVEEQAAFTIMPVDTAEKALAETIARAEVEQRPAEYATGAKECGFCNRDLETCGLYVDGMVRGDLQLGKHVRSLFRKERRGSGVGPWTALRTSGKRDLASGGGLSARAKQSVIYAPTPRIPVPKRLLPVDQLMKFTLVLPCHESADLSLAAVFVPCLVWMEGTRELLNPHRETPSYQRGDLQRVLALTEIRERLDSKSKKAVLVCHPVGHGTEACLVGLMADLAELGFDVVVVRQQPSRH